MFANVLSIPCTCTYYPPSWPQDPGKLRMQEDGVHFKSMKTGKALLVRHVDISDVEWLRVAKGFEVKLITFDGQIRKFDGFKESVSIDCIKEGCYSCADYGPEFYMYIYIYVCLCSFRPLSNS